MRNFLPLMAQMLADSLWQGLVIAAVTALGLRLLPRVSAAQRFAVWAGAFLLALLVPFLPMHGAAAGEPVRAGRGWGEALALAWLVAVAVRGTALLQQGFRVWMIWRAARPVEVSADVQAVLEGCSRRAEVCVSDEVSAPAVIGFRSPRLLVPAGLLAEMSEAELLQIALHECEHLRRYDDWLNFGQKVALAVFPLNPALFWLDKRLGLERELACDAGVVAATGAPLDYAACLTRLAEHRMSQGRMALALAAWARRSELARRVYTLLEPVRKVAHARVSLLALAGLLVTASAGLARAPELVSFAAAPVQVAAVEAAPVVMPARALPVVFHEPTARISARPVKLARRRVAVARRLAVLAPRQQRIESGYFVPVRYTYAAVPFGDGWLIVQL